MKGSGYYPPGAEFDPNAPWNQVDKEEKEVEVEVFITLSKRFKVKITDYEILDTGVDEDGNYSENIVFSDDALKSAVEEQITLPQDAHFFIKPDTTRSTKKVIEDLKGWEVDYLEVNEMNDK